MRRALLGLVFVALLCGCENGVTGLYVDGRIGAQYTAGAEDADIGLQLGAAVGVWVDPYPMREVRIDWGVGVLDATSSTRNGDLSVIPAGGDIGVALRPFGPFGSEFQLRYTGLSGTVKTRAGGAEDYAKGSGWSHGLALGYGLSTVSLEDAIGVRFGIDWQTVISHVPEDDGTTYFTMGPLLRVAILFPFSPVDSAELAALIAAEEAENERLFNEQRQREQEAGQRSQEQGEENYRYNNCLNTPGCHIR